MKSFGLIVIALCCFLTACSQPPITTGTFKLENNEEYITFTDEDGRGYVSFSGSWSWKGKYKQIDKNTVSVYLHQETSNMRLSEDRETLEYWVPRKGDYGTYTRVKSNANK